MSKDCLPEHNQHWCVSFETFSETQEKAHFHGDVHEHLLAVILATSNQNKRDNLKINYQYFYLWMRPTDAL